MCYCTFRIPQGGLIYKKIKYTVGVFGLVLLASCAGPNIVTDVSDAAGNLAGFPHGLWHGFTMGFALIGSIFTDDISIYEVHNNGGWYNFGFVLGSALCATLSQMRRK